MEMRLHSTLKGKSTYMYAQGKVTADVVALDMHKIPNNDGGIHVDYNFLERSTARSDVYSKGAFMLNF